MKEEKAIMAANSKTHKLTEDQTVWSEKAVPVGVFITDELLRRDKRIL